MIKKRGLTRRRLVKQCSTKPILRRLTLRLKTSFSSTMRPNANTEYWLGATDLQVDGTFRWQSLTGSCRDGLPVLGAWKPKWRTRELHGNCDLD
ncbi:hypothetical protein DPMN_091256 [Dreissena polymorpha]|uniref:Uncharacterized protein n=1 Tax=Dreissena polymorpha TaxID=45954 RepID=A0A9D4KZ80_DREPO|nr:hypothetical protein DPMN_091256 [Dreissena polymorpha]